MLHFLVHKFFCSFLLTKTPLGGSSLKELNPELSGINKLVKSSRVIVEVCLRGLSVNFIIESKKIGKKEKKNR